MAETQQLTGREISELRSLMDERSARDALVAYYTFEHSRTRAHVFGYRSGSSQPSGFVTRAWTGMDLFRPLVLPFVKHKAALRALLESALAPGQAFILHLPADQLGWAGELIDLDKAAEHELLRMDPASYEPVLNVLVVESSSAMPLPRYEIRTAGGLHAAAGVSWRGSRFAEIYLEADAGADERKMIRSVLSAVAGRVLGEQRIPLLRVPKGELASRTQAFHVGFRPTGFHSATADAVMRPPHGMSESDRHD